MPVKQSSKKKTKPKVTLPLEITRFLASISGGRLQLMSALVTAVSSDICTSVISRQAEWKKLLYCLGDVFLDCNVLDGPLVLEFSELQNAVVIASGTELKLCFGSVSIDVGCKESIADILRGELSSALAELSAELSSIAKPEANLEGVKKSAARLRAAWCGMNEAVHQGTVAIIRDHPKLSMIHGMITCAKNRSEKSNSKARVQLSNEIWKSVCRLKDASVTELDPIELSSDILALETEEDGRSSRWGEAHDLSLDITRVYKGLLDQLRLFGDISVTDFPFTSIWWRIEALFTYGTSLIRLEEARKQQKGQKENIRCILPALGTTSQASSA